MTFLQAVVVSEVIVVAVVCCHLPPCLSTLQFVPRSCEILWNHWIAIPLTKQYCCCCYSTHSANTAVAAILRFKHTKYRVATFSGFLWLFDLFSQHSFQLFRLFCRNFGRGIHSSREERSVRFWLVGESTWSLKQSWSQGPLLTSNAYSLTFQLLLLLLLMVAICLHYSSDTHH